MLLRKFINFCILIFSILFLALGISQFRQSKYDKNKLIIHKGIVGNIFKGTASGEKSKGKVLLVQLVNDTNTYTISRRVEYVTNFLTFGDSVEILTKEITSIFGNFITGESSIWNTENPNEVFHLVKKNNNHILIDFDKQKKVLINFVWVFPLCSILFLLWFLYRRSGTKSMLVMENLY